MENQEGENKVFKLKDEYAQYLKEQVKIVIDGIEINLWQHHTSYSVSSHEGWNKVRSYTELNSKTRGENGNLVFSGTLQIPRREALEYAVKLGFKVRSNVSKNTDFIIVGSDNVSPTKISKALRLNEEKGANINFVDENTFLSMVDETLIEDYGEPIPMSNINEYKKVKKQKTRVKKQGAVKFISDKLNGLTFVVSGVFSLFSRTELKNLIEQNGGKVSSSISKKTSYIVAGENMGPSKLAKAQDLGVAIIDEQRFSELINQ